MKPAASLKLAFSLLTCPCMLESAEDMLEFAAVKNPSAVTAGRFTGDAGELALSVRGVSLAESSSNNGVMFTGAMLFPRTPRIGESHGAAAEPGAPLIAAGVNCTLKAGGAARCRGGVRSCSSSPTLKPSSTEKCEECDTSDMPGSDSVLQAGTFGDTVAGSCLAVQAKKTLRRRARKAPWRAATRLALPASSAASWPNWGCCRSRMHKASAPCCMARRDHGMGVAGGGPALVGKTVHESETPRGDPTRASFERLSIPRPLNMTTGHVVGRSTTSWGVWVPEHAAKLSTPLPAPGRTMPPCTLTPPGPMKILSRTTKSSRSLLGSTPVPKRASNSGCNADIAGPAESSEGSAGSAGDAVGLTVK